MKGEWQGRKCPPGPLATTLVGAHRHPLLLSCCAFAGLATPPKPQQEQQERKPAAGVAVGAPENVNPHQTDAAGQQGSGKGALPGLFFVVWPGC